jgi:hypothetical protein
VKRQDFGKSDFEKELDEEARRERNDIIGIIVTAAAGWLLLLIMGC